MSKVLTNWQTEYRILGDMCWMNNGMSEAQNTRTVPTTMGTKSGS
eukprot:08860.XXX_356724_356858_1 [CDS] Oithona nana genome sequencing.